MLLRLLPVDEPGKLLLVSHTVTGNFDSLWYPVFAWFRERQTALAGCSRPLDHAVYQA